MLKKLLITVFVLSLFSFVSVNAFAQDIEAKTATSDNTSGFSVLNSSSTGLLRVRSDGNVGIGTTEPSNRLEVSGSTFNRITAAVTADVQSGYQVIRTAGTYQVGWEMYVPEDATSLRFAKKLPADPASVNILTMLDDGNVGIGPTVPSAKLHVQGTTGYNQLRLATSYTPTSTGDTNGNVGDIAWDDNYFYVKTSAGWKRSALSTW